MSDDLPERGGELTRITTTDLQILPVMPAREQQRSDAARDVTPRRLPAARSSAPPGPTSSSLPRTEACASCACGGLGWYSPGPTLGRAANATLVRCSCQAAADTARTHALLRQDRGRYASVTFDAFDAERPVPQDAVWESGAYNAEVGDWEDVVKTPREQRLLLRGALATLRRYADAPDGWIWLEGNYGSGKTHLAVAAANVLARAGKRTHYDTVPQLVKLLRAGIKDHSVDERLELLARVDLLVLDDLGMGTMSDWGSGQIEDLINERYNAERWTILTSNAPIAALGGRMGSRIAEESQVVTLVAYDMRLLLHAQRRAG